MKKLAYYPIFLVVVLYCVKAINIAFEIHKRIIFTLNPTDYLKSIFFLFKNGMLNEILLLILGLIGFMFRSKLGYVFSLIYPFYVICFLIVKTSFTHLWGQLLFAVISLLLLSLPITWKYFKSLKKDYFKIMAIAFTFGIAIAIIDKIL